MFTSVLFIDTPMISKVLLTTDTYVQRVRGMPRNTLL